MRKRTRENAARSLTPVINRNERVCAIVATEGDAGDLATVLASHPRIQTAERFFFRDVFRAACSIPAHIVPAASVNTTRVGRLAWPLWGGRDQKLVAPAAWSAIGSQYPIGRAVSKSAARSAPVADQ